MRAPGLTLRRGASIRRGRTGARRLLRLTSATAALAVAALFAGAAVPASATGASALPEASHASTLRSATSDDPLTAAVTADNAGVLAPHQNLAVSVTVTNTGNEAYTSGSVALWLDPTPQRSRDALSAWLTADDAPAGVTTLGKTDLPRLESGSSTVVRVTVPAASVPFAASTTPAVYGIGATVSAGSQQAIGRGSLVWAPGPAADRSAVTVALPIVSPAGSAGLISAADLATYTAPNGVLTRDLDGLEGHSTVAVGIDPMIIASIRVLGNAAPSTAVDWLDRLSRLPNDTFSLGYGDADVTGQLQAGLPAPLKPTSLSYAIDPKNFTPTPTSIGEPQTPTPTPTATGPTPTPTATPGPELPTLESLTSWDYSIEGIAWPGDKTVRAADLAPLASAGLTTTIVSGDNTNAASLPTTPSAPMTSGSNKLLSSDQRLSDALQQAASAPSDVAWNAAMGRLNAQLDLISQEGGDARHLLVALDRSWPSSGTQLARTLDGLLSSRWTTPSSFSALQASAPTGGHTLTDATESQTRADGIRALLADEQSLGQFATVLDDPTTLTGRVRAQLLTLLAVSWQNPRTDWSAAVAKSRSNTQKTLGSIKILPTENVNLVSAQGSIPFTVSNDLSDEAVTVVLTASPSNSRLEVDQSSKKRILADSRATVLVPVKAKVGNGQVLLSLQLYSPTGVRIGDSTSVTVDVHADWEGIGALIFGVLLVLLFGFGIVRNILRRRNERKRRAAEEAEGGADG